MIGDERAISHKALGMMKLRSILDLNTETSEFSLKHFDTLKNSVVSALNVKSSPILATKRRQSNYRPVEVNRIVIRISELVNCNSEIGKHGNKLWLSHEPSYKLGD
eukprot:582774-Rhodomonas_salina.1